MNFIELFAGIGGLGLGLERAGMTCVGQVEISSFCQRVLAKHWPNVARHDDVRTAVAWWRSERRPPVRLVAGGFPCQPASSAGHRRAQDDARWLWPEFAAFVRALRPNFVLVENVTGLLERGFGDVLGDLAACGYDAEWDCLPAATFGAPHLRDRVFALAQLHSWQGLMSLLDEHYPAEVFTGESGDEGPRIASLIRAVDKLRTQVNMLATKAQMSAYHVKDHLADRQAIDELRAAYEAERASRQDWAAEATRLSWIHEFHGASCLSDEIHPRVCACISDEQAAQLDPRFTRPVCAVHPEVK